MSAPQFRFKPFQEMRDMDYEAVGFRSGLEIHQQLFTAKKLFCRCPAGHYSEHHDAEILRHMRPTLSELGEYDGTALMEFKTKKEIIYRINRDTVCTYEMDDTPPFEINEEALDIALGIGMLYGCTMVDEIHIARKQYLDGSIPTGFQRTSIVALNGAIPYKGRKVSVLQLSIEEDSCREVSDAGHRRIYVTDRLGMPLIETVTGADMRTPQEVAEVGDLCRRLVRSTGRVRTGIGAARQDVNVSVTGGTRIEIKGVPRIPRIPLLTYNEAMRQWNLLRLRDELHRRGITPEEFRSSSEDVAKILRRTRYQPIRDAIDAGLSVRCVLLPGYRNLLNWQTQTGILFSREISDRVRVIACITRLPNIIHSDSPGETIASSEWLAIRKAVSGTDDDAIVVVWGEDDDVRMAASEVAIRAKEATIGVPSETRQALRDGTNGFERILPGPDRMYPDTDLPPKGIDPERLERLRATLPTPVWAREAWYRQLKVPTDLIEPLSISPLAPLFEKLVTQCNVNPTLAAVALIQFPKRLRKWRTDEPLPDEHTMDRIFSLLNEGKLVKDGIFGAMKLAMSNGGIAPEHLPPVCRKQELDEVITAGVHRMGEMKLRDPAKGEEVLMGIAMAGIRGRANGADVRKKVRTVMRKSA